MRARSATFQSIFVITTPPLRICFFRARGSQLIRDTPRLSATTRLIEIAQANAFLLSQVEDLHLQIQEMSGPEGNSGKRTAMKMFMDYLQYKKDIDAYLKQKNGVS